MKHRDRSMPLRRAMGLLTAAALALGLAACGAGSNQAAKLLRETFAGGHRINSGRLAMVLALTPSGASAVKVPITVGLAGPFQDLGPGKLPASEFGISLGALGATVAVAITSTGSDGYVTFQGRSYKLPQATFQQLEGTFAQVGSAPGGTGSGTLGRLGIHPERWLVGPQIVGTEAIDGIDTTHLRSRINAAALLSDLNTFLRHADSLGVGRSPSLAHGIDAATRERLAGEVKNPVLNVWTGVSDKTLRRLELGLGVPVGGRLSALLGRSASVALTIAYTNLNQPQRITAPTKLFPYAQFEAKLRGLVADFAGALGAGGSPPLHSSTSPSKSSSSSSSNNS